MSDLEPAGQPTIEDFLKVIITQNQRIYDVLLTILNATDQENATALLAKHANFENIGPMPFMEE